MPMRSGSLIGPARDLARWLVRWPGWFIAAFVVVQLALPLDYYLARRDPHDERFAWRMFSPTRMVTCHVTMTVDGQPVTLEKEFHDAWLALAARGRRTVIEQMGYHLCHEHKGAAVIARAQCRPLKGDPYDLGGFDLCTIPNL
ncbi:MAG TPA: hypothetical protein VHE35_30410 [Kofleriaceae bacterium]|nr:hypothetical protein [Kofleriaceae bacterium]